MTYASGVGSMPGGSFGDEQDNARTYAEATRVVLGELDLPHLVELPGRGAIADPTGRTLGLVAELGADLQPAGWRLTPGTQRGGGIDQRRARSLLSQDLDCLEDLAAPVIADGRGPAFFKVQIAGPWTLAATVEKPRGDRVLSDAGARRELAHALALAVAEHVADVLRRLPGCGLLVQVDEPALPAVLNARVPTASGFGRHRAVHPPEASEALTLVLAAITEAGAAPVVHCCAPEAPVDLLRGAGAEGVSLDVTTLKPGAYDPLAMVLEQDEWALLGVVPALEPAGFDERGPTAAVHRLFDMLGLAPTERTVITPVCGLAGASPGWVRRALGQARAVAGAFTTD